KPFNIKGTRYEITDLTASGGAFRIRTSDSRNTGRNTSITARSSQKAPEKPQSSQDARPFSPTSETREPLARGNPPVKRDTPQEAIALSHVETVKLRPFASGATAKIGGFMPQQL